MSLKDVKVLKDSSSNDEEDDQLEPLARPNSEPTAAGSRKLSEISVNERPGSSRSATNDKVTFTRCETYEEIHEFKQESLLFDEDRVPSPSSPFLSGTYHSTQRSADSTCATTVSGSVTSFRHRFSQFSIDNSCFDLVSLGEQSAVGTPIEKVFPKDMYCASLLEKVANLHDEICKQKEELATSTANSENIFPLAEPSTFARKGSKGSIKRKVESTVTLQDERNCSSFSRSGSLRKESEDTIAFHRTGSRSSIKRKADESCVEPTFSRQGSFKRKESDVGIENVISNDDKTSFIPLDSSDAQTPSRSETFSISSSSSSDISDLKPTMTSSVPIRLKESLCERASPPGSPVVRHIGGRLSIRATRKHTMENKPPRLDLVVGGPGCTNSLQFPPSPDAHSSGVCDFENQENRPKENKKIIKADEKSKRVIGRRCGNLRIIDIIRVKVLQIKGIRGSSSKPLFLIAKLDHRDIHYSAALQRQSSDPLVEEFSHSGCPLFSSLHIVILEGSRAPGKAPRPIGRISIKRKELVNISGREITLPLRVVSKNPEVQGQICLDIRRENGRFQLKVVDYCGLGLKEAQELYLLVTSNQQEKNPSRLRIHSGRFSEEWLDLPCNTHGILSIKMTLWHDLIRGINSVFHGQIRRAMRRSGYREIDALYSFQEQEVIETSENASLASPDDRTREDENYATATNVANRCSAVVAVEKISPGYLQTIWQSIHEGHSVDSPAYHGRLRKQIEDEQSPGLHLMLSTDGVAVEEGLLLGYGWSPEHETQDKLATVVNMALSKIRDDTSQARKRVHEDCAGPMNNDASISSKKTSMGSQNSVHVDIDERWTNGPSKWFYLRPKHSEQNQENMDNQGSKQSESLGEVRMWVSYAADHVLTADTYRSLMTAIGSSLSVQPHSASLLSLLENLPKVDLGVLARPLVQALAFSKDLRPLLATLYISEIEKCQDGNTLFRSQSLASKMLYELLKVYGHSYLVSTLKPVIDRIYKERKCCEIDPSRLEAGETLEKNTDNLLYYFSLTFSRVVESANRCPMPLKTILSDLRRVVGDKTGRLEMERLALSSFIIMRFFAAAILNPKSFGLKRDQPEPRVARTLVLLSKMLQRLANCCVSEQTLSTKEPWLCSILDKVTDVVHRGLMCRFLDRVSLHAADASISTESITVLKEGYLLETRTRTRPAWRKMLHQKKRYVILTDSEVLWQKSHRGELNPKGSFNLSELRSSSIENRNVLVLKTQTEEIALEASSSIEANDWLQSIDRQTNRVRRMNSKTELNDLFETDVEREMEAIHVLLLEHADTLTLWKNCLSNGGPLPPGTCPIPPILEGKHLEPDLQEVHRKRLILTLDEVLGATFSIESAHREAIAIYTSSMEQGSGTKENPIGDDNYLLLKRKLNLSS